MIGADVVEAAAARILARPPGGRLAAFTAECLAAREWLRREFPDTPPPVRAEAGKDFGRLLIERVRRAEGR